MLTAAMRSTNSAPPHNSVSTLRTLRTTSAPSDDTTGAVSGVLERVLQRPGLLGQLRGDHVHPRLRLLDAHAGRQPRDLVVRLAPSRLLALLLRRERERHPDAHVRVEEREVGGHDSDDREGLAAEPDVAPHDVRTRELPLPEPVAEDRHLLVTDLVVRAGEQASARGARSRTVKNEAVTSPDSMCSALPASPMSAPRKRYIATESKVSGIFTRSK